MRKILTISLLLCGIGNAHAQYNDARLWLSANIEKRVSLKTSLHFTESVRFFENYTQVGTVYSDFGVKYRIGEKWRISGHYRFSKKRNNNETYSTGSRFYADLVYKQKVGGKLDFSFRTRYQRQYTDYNSSYDGHVPKNHVRFKLTMNIDLDRRYKPYLAGELFYQLSNSRYQHKFDNSRYYAGFMYDLNKKNQIDIHYMIIRGFNTKNPARYYVLSLNYYYSF